VVSSWFFIVLSGYKGHHKLSILNISDLKPVVLEIQG
tara:strand:+ start:2985 stop:3095 length:111 start_codon:yes stop_codon:yes gene_type:complete